jgi:undecaprenyl-diphosphatase
MARIVHILLRIIRWLGRHDLWLVGALAAAAAGIWIFVALAEVIREREAHAIDQAILLAMRNPADLGDPIGPRWFEELARDVTALGGMAALGLVTLVVVGYLLLRREPAAAVLIAVTALGAQLASTILKLSFARPRPELVPAFAYVYSASFPSGHAMMAAAMYLTFALQLAAIQRERDSLIRGYLIAVALVFVVAVGLTRVYLGVHWPTDVLAGWAAGGAWALLVWGVARFFATRRAAARARAPAVSAGTARARSRRRPRCRRARRRPGRPGCRGTGRSTGCPRASRDPGSC